MLILKYAKSDKTVDTITERLQKMTLSFQKEEIESTDYIELFDGTKSFKGLTAIQTYLDDLEKDLHSWYYCAC